MRQTGLNMGAPAKMTGTANLRAVVINVYFADDEGGREDRAGGQIEAKGVSVDVLTYGGPNRGFIARVPVAQRRHGLNDYTDLWVPRPTTVDLSTGQPPILAREDGGKMADPRNLDGDNVIVEFLENNPGQPYIRDSLPHPRAKFRQLRSDDAALRTRLRGVEVSIDQNGNLRVDASKACGGTIDSSTGNETPADDSSHGKLTMLVGRHTTLAVQGVSPDGTAKTFELTLKDGEFEVRLQDGASFKVDGSGAGAAVVIGDGSASAVRGERLQAQYEELVAALAGHVHSDGFGSTGPPTAAPPVPGQTTFPTWGANILSTSFKIVDS